MYSSILTIRFQCFSCWISFAVEGNTEKYFPSLEAKKWKVNERNSTNSIEFQQVLKNVTTHLQLH